MWILKKSKDLLEYIQSNFLSSCNFIKTFEFSTLYTSIPHSKLKEKLKELVLLCFIKKNGKRRYKYLVLDRNTSLFWIGSLWFKQRIPWNWHYQDAWFLDWQHICYVQRTCFSTDCGHSYGNQLCPSSCRLVSLLLWGRLYTGTS